MKLAIVGAGPRGLLILERLIAWQQNHYPLTSVDITLYDPFPIGGRVWVTDQPHELIMNTASQQITLFMITPSKLTGHWRPAQVWPNGHNAMPSITSKPSTCLMPKASSMKPST